MEEYIIIYLSFGFLFSTFCAYKFRADEESNIDMNTLLGRTLVLLLWPLILAAFLPVLAAMVIRMSLRHGRRDE